MTVLVFTSCKSSLFPRVIYHIGITLIYCTFVVCFFLYFKWALSQKALSGVQCELANLENNSKNSYKYCGNFPINCGRICRETLKINKKTIPNES